MVKTSQICCSSSSSGLGFELYTSSLTQPPQQDIT
jgi:hypothetical protein